MEGSPKMKRVQEDRSYDDATHDTATAHNRPTCSNCRKDRQRCHYSGASASCERCLISGYPCTLSAIVSNPKRRKLDKLKCSQCRQSKQKCLPENRKWPEKCHLCLQKELPCSEPQAFVAESQESVSFVNGTSPSVFDSGRGSSGQISQHLSVESHRTTENEMINCLSNYSIAIFCSRSIGLASIEAMLDEIHEPPTSNYNLSTCTFGRLGGHNVIVSVLPRNSTGSSAAAVKKLHDSLPCIRFGLLVEVSPNPLPDTNIHLGDVVVTQPIRSYQARKLTQHDMRLASVEANLGTKAHFDESLPSIGPSLQKLQARHLRVGSQINTYLVEMALKFPRMRARCFLPNMVDSRSSKASHSTPGNRGGKHKPSQTILNPVGSEVEPQIHYNTIALGNTSYDLSHETDRCQEDISIVHSFIEGSCLLDNITILIIRGVYDFGMTKSEMEEAYAAATAAAYTKELLASLPTWQNTVASTKLGLRLDNAPATNPALFVGRHQELQCIQNILCSDGGKQRCEQRRVVIGGMGGMGKTQLALQYARLHHTWYDSVFWLDATSEISLGRSMRSVAQLLNACNSKRLNDEDARTCVWNWLSDPTNTSWLVIIDALDELDEPNLIDIEKYMPSTRWGSILITTRLPVGVGGEKLYLRPFQDSDSCLSILRSLSERMELEDDQNLNSLAERLGGYPLALAIAGGYLERSKVSIESYLRDYEKFKYTSSQETVLFSEHHERIFVKLMGLSTAHVNRSDHQAASLLQVLIYFDCRDFWQELLGAGIDCPHWLKAITKNTSHFEEVMTTLIEYNFVEKKSRTKSYSMHIFVHDCLSITAKGSTKEEFFWYALSCVGNALSAEYRTSYGQSNRARLIPHALHIAQLYASKQPIRCENMEHYIDAASNVARLLEEEAHFAPAEAMCVLAAEEARTWFGHNHASALSAMNKLGNLYRLQRKFNHGEQILLDTLSGAERMLGLNNATTLSVVENLGLLYTEQGELAKAETMYIRVLCGYNKLLGQHHPLSLGALCALGNVFRLQNKFDKAEKYLFEALTKRTEVLGRDHASTTDSFEKLKQLYVDRCTQELTTKLTFDDTEEQRRQTSSLPYPVSPKALPKPKLFSRQMETESADGR